MGEKSMDYYKIGQNIRKYRKLCGLSQEELAERVGISVTHMSHIETGNTKLSLPVLVDLSAVLGVGTDTLLFEEARNGRERSLDALSEAAEDCSERELAILTDLVQAVKLSLRKNDNT